VSRRQLSLAIAVVVLVSACTNRAPNGTPLRANVGETLNVRLASASVPQAIRALQSSSTLDDATVGLQIYPTYAVRRSSTVAASVYTAALDDARAKAQAIADYARVKLGNIRSVDEVAPTLTGNSFSGAGRLEPMPPPRSSSVSAPAGGVVMLAVTFEAGSVPISVLGTHAGPPPQYDLHDATGVSVEIRARGETLGAAQRRMSAVEDSIRSIVTQYGATARSVVVTSADANTF
jgi:hypothetical protein